MPKRTVDAQNKKMKTRKTKSSDVDFPPEKQWTFLTNHAHVLIMLHSHPDMSLREVALQVGITERAVQIIVLDLDVAGFLGRERIGRKNHYTVIMNKSLRHPIESHCKIGDLLNLIVGGKAKKKGNE